MKNILLTLVLVTAASGQTPSPSPADYSDSDAGKPVAILPARPNEQPRTLDEIKALTKANKTKDDIFVFYDKFKDESAVIAKPENLVGSWEGAFAIMGSSPRYGTGPGTPRVLVISVETRFAGQTLRETPDRFLLRFDGMSPDWQLSKGDATLYILFDGDKRMTLEAAGRDHDVVRYNRVDEKVAYVITREQIAQLASSTGKVEIRIGTAVPREIKPKILKHWRAVLDATKLDAEK